MRLHFLTIGLLAFASPLFAEVQGEITVWCMGAEGTQIPQLARAFEEGHPGTRIITQAVPWSGAHDRLITAVAGDIAPDMAQLGTTWVPEFAAMGALVPLDERMSASETLSSDSFFEGSLAAAQWQGDLVALPWYVDTRVIFYRSDILAEAGWDHFPTTWAELEQMGTELTRDFDGDGEIDQYAFNFPPRGEGEILNFIWQAGGRVMDDSLSRCTLDSPETREALTFYQSLFSRGFSPLAETGQMDQYQAFRDGFFLGWLSGPWMVGEYERRLPDLTGRWAVAMVPGNRSRTSFLGGSNLAIFRSGRNPELAWAFAEYLSQPEIQLEWYHITGDLPAVREAWEAPEFSDNPTWSVFRAQIEDSRPPPPVECWEAMAEVIKNRMENLTLGGQSADAVAAAMQRDMEGILARRRVGEGNIGQSLASVIGGGVALLVFGSALMLWRGRHWLRRWRRWRVPAIFLTPILVHVTLFLFLPLLASLMLSFTDSDIYSLTDWRRTSWTGMSNYTRLWGDPLFWRSAFNTLVFVAVAGPLTLALSLGSALMLNSAVAPMRGLFRTGYFLPVVTPLVAVAVVWRWIYSPRHGLLNWAIGLVGVPEQTWLADPHLAMACLILLAIWKNFGFAMVIFLAGLQTIPRSLYEAAEIDGAGVWHRFRRITLPLLKPTTVFITIMTTIGYMQVFAEPYVMTEMGGPQNRTLTIVLYLYKEGFKFFHLGYASAIAYTLCAMIALLSLVQMRWARGSEAAA